MSKFYKTYANACRFTGSTVEAVTLDGIQGFMSRAALSPINEIAHDTAAWMTSSKRHFVTVELSNGLFGSHWYDDIIATPKHPITQTLFSTKEAATAAHQATVERYRSDPKWQA